MFGGGVPRLPWSRGKKGKPAPSGSRLDKYGLTPAERLMSKAPVDGTKPERMIYGWLVRNNYSFTFQQPVSGGRLIMGGAVIDFVILDKYPPIALRVQSYWHQGASAEWADDVQAEMLREMGYQVEDVWEHELVTVEETNEKMMEILYGANKHFGGTTARLQLNCPYCDDPNCVRCDI